MYSSDKGHVTDWHRVHYPTRAVGGVGMVIVEATAVDSHGMISPNDMGIWSDEHVAGLRELVGLIEQHGAASAIQLAHAGRKSGSAPDGTMDMVGPSDVPFDEGRTPPRAMDRAEMNRVRDAFVAATKRAIDAGFKAIEVHAAHGYLLSSFFSPLANFRKDEYGGSFENRMRYPLEVVEAVRAAMPVEMPLLVRVSAIDPEEGGVTIEETVAFSKELKARGVDLIDCSTGGNSKTGWARAWAGYQVPFAEAVRKQADIASGAVGMISEPKFADEILQKGQADLVFLGRELLRDPYWALRAAAAVGHPENTVPRQYTRAWGR
jgi:2,4-dienoyl-CoA reductase-like NADH-dependent reductase (Old Yellow Enzyme family)